MQIKPIALDKQSFSEYGEVLSVEDSDSIIINDGYAKKHYNLCNMDIDGGVSTIHLYIGKKREFPLAITMMEKHPHFSQTFMPRSSNPFLAVVALGDDKPELSTLKAFKTNGNQGLCYKKGIWHFPLIVLEEEEQFIVIDRNDLGLEENKVIDCIEIDMEEKIEVLKEI